MNKKRRNNNEIIERIEFNNEMTRFLSDAQYLVTLNILNSLNALSTEKPKEPPFTADHTTSNIEPDITTQSNRLNDDSKYIRGPSAYTFMNISVINKPRNTNSA